MRIILAVLLVFTLAACDSPEDVVCEIDEEEVVVTETEIVYVDRPLGVSEDEMNLYLWHTLKASEDLDISVGEDDMITATDEAGITREFTFGEWMDWLESEYEFWSDW